MKTTTNPYILGNLLRSTLAESHRRQFGGEDYQGVAAELCEAGGFEFESDEHVKLESGPDPDCECGFCATAAWQD
jgi:hypothetical protein